MKFVNCLASEMDNARVSEVFNKPKYKFVRILKEMPIECLMKSWGRLSVSSTHYLRLYDRLQHKPNSFPVAGHTNWHTHTRSAHTVMHTMLNFIWYAQLYSQTYALRWVFVSISRRTTSTTSIMLEASQRKWPSRRTVASGDAFFVPWHTHTLTHSHWF